MANGKLGNADLAGATETTVYTVPSQKTATFGINVTNRNDGYKVKVKIAIAAANPADSSEFIEYNTTIAPNGVLERTGLVASAGEVVTAYADASGVSVRVFGFEE